MAHKQCVKKMRKYIWCDCINDDLEELKQIRKLLSKYRIKNFCMELAKDTKAIEKIVNRIYGGKK